MIGMSRLGDALGLNHRRHWPALGAVAPGITPRLVLGGGGALLSVAAYTPVSLIVVGALLALVAAAVPRTMAAWVLILFLAASQIPRDHSALHWRLLVLLFGLHLIHVLGAQALELPVRSSTEVAVFRTPLRRFVTIQVPVQIVAVLTLLLLAPGHDHGGPIAIAALGTVGALAFVAVTLVLTTPFLRQKRRP
jgi:hypothetical protein